ncbi:hypothetical protein LIA77_04682 [Sarocladium implicatum]|nr:hypothetical protein LIA77_04682 [Sarocladium implicatum]
MGLGQDTGGMQIATNRNRGADSRTRWAESASGMTHLEECTGDAKPGETRRSKTLNRQIRQTASHSTPNASEPQIRSRGKQTHAKEWRKGQSERSLTWLKQRRYPPR